ncbi:hypothetical protein OSB04_011101, partial [Centaurea solstitialis]
MESSGCGFLESPDNNGLRETTETCLIEDIDANGYLVNNEDSETEYENQTQVDVDFDFDENEFDGETFVGKVFDKLEEVYTFYNRYALLHGFGIRSYSVHKNRITNEPYRKMYVCNKQGFKRVKVDCSGVDTKKRRRDSRTGCEAELQVSKAKDGKWVVDKFSDIHNHDLTTTPTKVLKHRSHAKFHRPMASDVTSKQCADILIEQRKQYKGKEFYGLIKHFQDKASVDINQYFVVDLFEDGSPRNIFWADGRSRDSYMKFGDVVVFDVTYMTNKFKMPFAPFVGVNHHGQTILFGGALLENEKEETFEWLFENFLKCIFLTLVIFNEINENAIQCIVLHSIIVLKKIPQNSKWDINAEEIQGPDVKLSFKFQKRKMGNGSLTNSIKKAVNAIKSPFEADVTSKQCADILIEQRKQYKGKEFYGLIKHFQDKASVDINQYFVVDLFEDGSPRNIFWADGRSRDSYMKFGDVVVFDVTYMTNKFKMPFAPFVGVNHHGQTILFGGALLENEKEETFEWLFENFLKCMFSKHPKAIITDQDKAMGNAIKKVFPSTRHRYCAWHIRKHELEHLRSFMARYDDFAETYRKWVKSDTVEEFESQWEVVCHKYNLQSSAWMTNMYDQRKFWVKAFLKDVFLAGMTTSGRSESIHYFFDGFVNSRTMLNEFVIQYDRVVECRRAAEEDEDFKTMNSMPILLSVHPIEAKACKLYSRKIFELFKKEWN